MLQKNPTSGKTGRKWGTRGVPILGIFLHLSAYLLAFGLSENSN
jgi:hypothetical protein